MNLLKPKKRCQGGDKPLIFFRGTVSVGGKLSRYWAPFFMEVAGDFEQLNPIELALWGASASAVVSIRCSCSVGGLQSWRALKQLCQR